MTKERYPECKKLEKVSKEIGTIRSFFDFIAEKEMELGKYNDNDRFLPCNLSNDGIEKLLNECYELDGDKLERERREMLKDVRSGHV